MTVAPSIAGDAKRSVALGFFDGFHLGHAGVISSARALGGLACAWTIRSDDGAFSKGEGRVTDDATKLRLLRDAGAEYVAVSDFESVRDMTGSEFFYKVLIGAMDASAIVCGADFRFGRNALAGVSDLKRLCRAEDLEFKAVGDVTVDGERVSSTRIRSLISSGNVSDAAKLLGRPYSICASVVRGKALGRTIGYPTINQKFPAFVLTPARGVYASVVKFTDKDGVNRVLPGASNVGVCPTVSDDGAAVCETHIIGYSGDLYGVEAEVMLLLRLRGEKKFSGIEELTAQISADSEKSKEIALNYLSLV